MTIRLSPLYIAQQTAGASHHEQAGWMVASAPIYEDEGLSIHDCSADSNLLVEGTSASDLLRDLFGNVPTGIGRVISADIVDIGQLTPTRFCMRARVGEDAAQMHRLTSAATTGHVTITNQSDGLGGLLLTGERAPEVLGMLCGLNFADDAFPVGSIRAGSFAKVRATLWRSPSVYRIYVGRSYLAYVADVTRQAAELSR